MNINKIAIILTLIISVATTALASSDLPKEKVVNIQKPVTKLIVDILPGRGVKCIFPWVLDVNSTELPYTSVLTNDGTFENFREPGQNYIVYKIKSANISSEGELGDAFINVAGYHINLTLRVSFSRKKHYSTIIFKLKKAQRLELIERAINRRQKALIEEYGRKEAELNQRAEKLALKLVGRLAISGKKTSNIKEEKKLKLDNGDRVVFYADKVASYGNIHVIPIEIKNDSRINPLYIKNISLEKKTSGGDYPLISEFEIAPKISINETAKGFVVTNDKRLLNNEDAKMTLFCDQGEIPIEW